MNIPRLPWERYWMLLAHLTATRSTCDRGPELLFDPGRHGVGAVLVKNRRAIAGGYNGSAPGQPHCDDVATCSSCGRKHGVNDGGCCCDNCGGEVIGGHLMREGHCVRTIHSEMNALMQCALDGVSPQGAELFCTASPCFDCAKAIIRAGIVKVFYGQTYDSRYGLSRDVGGMFEDAGIETEQLVITRKELSLKIKVVPSEELNPAQSLRPKDYITPEFMVTFVEEVETDKIVRLDAQTNYEAMSMLVEMDDADFIKLMDEGQQTDLRVISRDIIGVEGWPEKN